MWRTALAPALHALNPVTSGEDEMTLEWLIWIAVINGAVQLVGFAILILGQRELMRMVRAVAGLVYQEEQKTQILVRDLFSGGR